MKNPIIILILTILFLDSCTNKINTTNYQKSIEKAWRDSQGNRYFFESNGDLTYEYENNRFRRYEYKVKGNKLTIILLGTGILKQQKYNISISADGKTLTLTGGKIIPGLKESEFGFSEYILTGIKITEHRNYRENEKSFSLVSTEQLEFLEGFSEKEIAESIEELNVFYPYYSVKQEDLNFIEQTKDLIFIKRFSQLKRFYLDLFYLENIEPLSYLNNIEDLTIELTNVNKIDPITDFSPIGNLKTLKRLELSGYKDITDISSISNLENLEELKIGSGIKINNINPVFDLRSLKKLILNIQNLSDLTQIKKLKNLEYFEAPVVLDKNLLYSLLNLKHLKKIKIVYVAVKDVSSLLILPDFEKIECQLKWDLNFVINNYVKLDSYFYFPIKGIEIIKQFLDGGADPNEKYEAEYFDRGDSSIYYLDAKITPLMMSRSADITELLLKYGARVNDLDKYGRTALMISSFFDGYDYNKYYDDEDNNINYIGKILIDNGADINIKSYKGQTALHFAVIGRNIASMKMLIENGANVNIRDNKGLTPLMATKIYHYNTYYGYPKDQEKFEQILINAGAVLSNNDIQIINKLKEKDMWGLGDLDFGIGDIDK